ncbi:hypothetical protein AXG93_1998s1300 [Marchantia polymorpha subsp. ruderalis]|uniref:Uncharacterized protein n=1 Tax=Marchantia polymorpha subsp. ruderalis TaxID=1480154 RepID=A0A176VLY1_MARPO|nr:hypothetical protein AXG93_1998s1300 [Marchantia polymorpha subsp. ruderalis]
MAPIKKSEKVRKLVPLKVTYKELRPFRRKLNMAPIKKSEKVRKLVPLKVTYEELRPFRRKLSEFRLEFLLRNWNCVSVSICKEIVDKNKTEGEDLRGNPMLWTIEHWTKVLGRCAGSDGDLIFEKISVVLTRTEEFSYGTSKAHARGGLLKTSRVCMLEQIKYIGIYGGVMVWIPITDTT